MERQDTVEKFRERLHEVIARSGGSRSAFAARVGIDRSTISQILSPTTNRLPRVETLAAIAASEHVSLDWLLGLSEEQAPVASDLLPSLEIRPGGGSPSDERLAEWQRDAIGYKIRHVPATLPDVLKIDELIEFVYRKAAAASPEQRMETSQTGLEYQRRDETDTEVCSAISSIDIFARGLGQWKGLKKSVRKRQLMHMARLVDELYPTYRWFLFDPLERYSVPLTVFGSLRAVIYVGQAYLVFNTREHIRELVMHFDNLIRAAIVQPTEVVGVLQSLHDSI